MSTRELKKVWISGKLVDPLVEGGKGIGATNGMSSGSWAACGGVGTISGAGAHACDENENPIPLHFSEPDRNGRYKELSRQQIDGAISQLKIANRVNKEKKGALHINMLWETSGVEPLLSEVFSEYSSLLDGITCGAGLPFELSEICAKHKKYYNPIVSSDRAFSLLWRRSYHKFSEYLGSVVYEDPWVAGGHNGLTSQEDPLQPQPAYNRVLALRKAMNSFGLNETTIIIAGGVWTLSEWIEYLDNPDLAPIAFQFGTRPLLTKESPISDEWKSRLLEIKEGDVKLHKFSPTGYFSSAVNNHFLQELYGQIEREIDYRSEPDQDFSCETKYGRRSVYVKSLEAINQWINEGYTQPMKTPDNTLIFVTPERAQQILLDQQNCMGCLRRCKFSNWSESDGSTGIAPDPRSFCILKTLDNISRGGSVDNNLMFAGKNVYRFAQDPFYANGYIPTVAELYARIIEEVQRDIPKSK